MKYFKFFFTKNKIPNVVIKLWGSSVIYSPMSPFLPVNTLLMNFVILILIIFFIEIQMYNQTHITILERHFKKRGEDRTFPEIFRDKTMDDNLIDIRL